MRPISTTPVRVEPLVKILYDWVDSVTGVVATPGVGRVMLTHENGTETRISSPDLPFRLALPMTFESR